ncbi:dUTPase [Singapore grouper iridovirus]|nr:dUTPase [Singapore grouper iridovirus]
MYVYPAMNSPKLRFSKITDRATTPTKGSKLSAGYDLYSAQDLAIEPKGYSLVKTDIRVAVPHGHYGRVAARSGLAVRHGIDVGAGVIDEDYRGNVGVVLFNHDKHTFYVLQGDRIAQLICEKISYPELKEEPELDIEETERGSAGFGSTGVRQKK